jgi:carbonic anhydrase/acetyltransferase-like protein (isoleucine patch superfamily)
MSEIRKVVITPSWRVIAPFMDPVGEVQLLDRTLRAVQEEAIAAAGLTLVGEPPPGEPYLAFSDRTFVTEGTLTRLLAQARAPARARVEDAVYLENTLPLQDLPEPGLYELGLFPAGAPPDYAALPPVTLDLELLYESPPAEHPAIAHAAPERVAAGDAALHQVDHWSHILRINWMMMAATIAREKRRFEERFFLMKIALILLVWSRARFSLNPFKLAAALNQIGKDCIIHPTAVVEGAVLGDGVNIGPFAVVRGSVLGKGVRVEEYAVVNMSALGEGARIGRRGTCNLCVLYPGAFFGAGNGYQACVFGRESFAAWTTTVFDLSFDKHVRVMKDGERVDSGTFFLGAAIGHRAKLGGLVTLGYGAAVPNDAFVVGDSGSVLRGWEDGPGPHRVVDGVARPVAALKKEA